MPLTSNIQKRYRKNDVKRIVQGDIFRDVQLLDWELDEVDPSQFKPVQKNFPYIVVLSQDCDLLSDYRNWTDINIAKKTPPKHDKYLQSVLVSPAYILEQFKRGEHLIGQGYTMEKIGSDRLKNIVNLTDPRYHFLPAESEFQIPDLVIDFKHYFSNPLFYLYNYHSKWYVASLNELFRESLSLRFSNFLGRVGLPVIKEVAQCDDSPT